MHTSKRGWPSLAAIDYISERREPISCCLPGSESPYVRRICLSHADQSMGSSWTFSSFTIDDTMMFLGSAAANEGFAEMVQDWVTTPAHNNGMMIREPALEGTDTSFIGWWTKDGGSANGSAGLDPSLTVIYN
jgi:hypothetical protein